MIKLIDFFRALREFFPLHLLFSHLKYNLIVLFYWAFLFAIINGSLGVSIGLPYLFLSPEYLNDTNYLSFLLLGFSVGGFIMAFHTYSYIQLGPKYPFIATLSRPFFKFSLNNSLIPLIFIINLTYNIIRFQKSQEFLTDFDLIKLGASFIFGVFIFVAFSFFYFFPTNKDLFRLTGIRSEDYQSKTSNVKAALHRKQSWYKDFLRVNVDQYYYLGRHLKIKRSRSSVHYDKEVLDQVFSQNHINASVFEVVLILSFFAIGFFRDYEFFQVPASVSIMMLFTIILMLVSAFFSWFRSWTYPIIVALFLLINYLSRETEMFQFKSYALGLSYEKEDMVEFSQESLQGINYSDSVIQADYEEFVKTLNNWKKSTGLKQPKLVILNTSGGGLRSAMWTFSILQKLDSLTHGKFIKHVQMGTGASGGMIGAAYYRELLLKELSGKIENRLENKYRKNISKDLLNRLSFSISTSDIFFRFQQVEINGREYAKDRGYAFEQELISNLDGAFDRSLGSYVKPEKSGKIPTLIFTPTIVNDGRRLLISAQHLGFLQATSQLDERIGLNSQIENVEYLKYFKENVPYDIRFTTVLRMSATFPYIMPMVTMPTKPGMHVMDAGIRDNYGTKTTVRYLLALRKWIKENTSGVIILKVRDSKKAMANEIYSEIGLIDKLFLPFGNMYGNFPRVQDFDQDELLSATIRTVDYPIQIVSLNLREDFRDRIALSWHLTKQEKNKIVKAINSSANKSEIERLLKIMNFNYDDGEGK
ncbi:MAG: patatin-like phospholipase family protein [Brumimicrobium sp.]|nr:patatin-like phospholipase family protein [Brumimicrobium sp.]